MKRALLILIILIIALCSFLPIFRGLFNVVVIESATNLARKTDISSSKVRSYFKLSQLDREVRDLKEKNAELESIIAQYKDIAHENSALRKETNLSARWSEKYKLQSARVLGKTPKTYWQSIVIDKGAEDNLQKNNVVIYRGYLMGVISEVFPRYAYVDIVSTNKIFVPVVLVKSRGTGILRGGLAGLFMDEIPLEYKIEVGDTVVTQNFENQVVAGIPVGKVKRVIIKKGDIFQSAQIELPIDFVAAEIVTVIGVK